MKCWPNLSPPFIILGFWCNVTDADSYTIKYDTYRIISISKNKNERVCVNENSMVLYREGNFTIRMNIEYKSELVLNFRRTFTWIFQCVWMSMFHIKSALLCAVRRALWGIFYMFGVLIHCEISFCAILFSCLFHRVLFQLTLIYLTN